MPMNDLDGALLHLRDVTEPIAGRAYVRISLNGMLSMAVKGKTRHAICDLDNDACETRKKY